MACPTLTVDLTVNTSNPNVLSAGFRSEQQTRYSGYMDANTPNYWSCVGQTMASKWAGSQKTAIWIAAKVSTNTTDRNTYLEFPTPGGTYPNIQFGTTDKHEAYLTAFDNAGVKVYLQIEPGDADIATVITLLLNRYGSHPSVIGIGVDVEWYKYVDNPDGKPVTNAEAQAWINQIHGINPNYKLFIKHWDATYLPTVHYPGIFYINDSMNHACLTGCADPILDKYTTFASAFPDAKVGIQIGYAQDRTWWSAYPDPAKTIGDALIAAIPNLEGIYWADAYWWYQNYTDPFAACQNAPPPALVAEADGAYSGLRNSAIVFSGSATGGTPPYTYSWSFGDGTNSVLQNPSHAYSVIGNYTATLTVKDNAWGEATDTSTVTITDNIPPALIAEADGVGGAYSGLRNTAINFIGSAVGGTAPYTYSWVFGDGASSSIQNPSHAYTTVGNYVATLIVTDSLGVTALDTATVTVTDTAPPPLIAEADGVGGAYSGDTNTLIQFSGSATGGVPPYSFNWVFGDGTSTTGQLPSHTYTTAGNYTAILTVHDNAGGTATDTAPVTITQAPVIPTLDVGFRTEQQTQFSGYQNAATPNYWSCLATTMASKWTGTRAVGEWVIGKVSGNATDRNTYMNFPNPGGTWANVLFSTIDTHDAYLTAFDNAGVKVYIEAEPGDANVSDLINLLIGKYGHHPCVIGFGIDIEWNRYVDNPDGLPVSNADAQAWINLLKTYNPNYKLFLKHWSSTFMPTIHYTDVIYINDSMNHACLSGCADPLLDRYIAFAGAFPDAKVGFQIGFSQDRPWWSLYADPAKTIGDAMIASIPNLECIFWSDSYWWYQNYPDPFATCMP